MYYDLGVIIVFSATVCISYDITRSHQSNTVTWHRVPVQWGKKQELSDNQTVVNRPTIQPDYQAHFLESFSKALNIV